MVESEKLSFYSGRDGTVNLRYVVYIHENLFLYPNVKQILFPFLKSPRSCSDIIVYFKWQTFSKVCTHREQKSELAASLSGISSAFVFNHNNKAPRKHSRLVASVGRLGVAVMTSDAWLVLAVEYMERRSGL